MKRIDRYDWPISFFRIFPLLS